jgi:D-alanine-D-alanine ligase
MRIGIACTIQGQVEPPPDASDDWDEEFDRPETVEAIAAALRDLGHDVEVLGDGPPLVRRLLDDPPDFVFNFAEGSGISRSREARVPAVLEMLGIPYSGSDPLTLAVTLDKECAKRLVQSVGVKTPRWVNVPRPAKHVDLPLPGHEVLQRVQAAGLSLPLFVKPVFEGSSKGIGSRSLVNVPEELVGMLRDLQATYRQPALVEEFIEGDDVTVGVLGNDPPRVLGMMRVLPAQPTERFIYSVEAKRDWRRLIHYETPAQLPPSVSEFIAEAALAAYRVLGCRDFARVDFRLRNGEPYFLETNPLPGLHPENGDIVMIARACGMSHAELVQNIFRAACARQQFAGTRDAKVPGSR